MKPKTLSVSRVRHARILTSPVKLLFSRKPRFVNEYVRVPVKINPASGLTMDGLDFRALEGRPGGDISLSRDATFNLTNPTVMLLCGYRPGTYHLQVFKKGSTTLLTQAKFA